MNLRWMLLCLNCTLPAWAGEDAARIVEITFEGNRVTVPETMRREISLGEGDPADEQALQASRQRIQDLGLFREVAVRQEPVEGGVRVVFAVTEKFYLLLYPRLSANADGQNSLGLEARWNNLWGKNHGLRALVSSRDSGDADRGRALRGFLGYSAPFVGGSAYDLDLHAARQTTPYEMPVVYDERLDELGFQVSCKLFADARAASQGWRLGSGLTWTHQSTEGVDAPEPYGNAIALVTELSYRDFRNNIFSDTGQKFRARYAIADRHMGSDYSYSELSLDYKRAWLLGSPHENLVLSAKLGSSNNRVPGQSVYQLGGANGLRGYDRNFANGNFYYLLTAEYLRPLYWDWLRVVVSLEAGNAYEAADMANDRIYSNLGLGLRVRLPRLVNFEFEAGLAFPLREGGGHRFYGERTGRD